MKDDDYIDVELVDYSKYISCRIYHKKFSGFLFEVTLQNGKKIRFIINFIDFFKKFMKKFLKIYDYRDIDNMF